MVFKRRDKPTGSQRLRALIYPPGGWQRALNYVVIRLRRLPDRPARIARGIGCGVFVCFTPIFGFHFFGALFLAWLVKGNKFAALLATFFGNPITFPIIAATSIELGEWILQVETPIPLSQVLGSFAQAFGQLSANLVALITRGTAEWDKLHVFFHGVFVPYFVGGLGPGLVVGTLAYVLSHKIILAAQKRRRLRARKKKSAKADIAVNQP